MMNTIEYYDENASKLFELYNSADMSESQSLFMSYLRPGCSIVDIGCGSGRDMKAFASRGFLVEGIDGSEYLARLASVYSGCKVECVDFLSWKPERKYDAFWANASLLHLDEKDLLEFFRTKLCYLAPGGIFYFAMKQEIETGVDAEGRFFQNFTESILEKILQDSPELSIVYDRSSGDSLGRNISWRTIIFRKRMGLHS